MMNILLNLKIKKKDIFKQMIYNDLIEKPITSDIETVIKINNNEKYIINKFIKLMYIIKKYEKVISLEYIDEVIERINQVDNIYKNIKIDRYTELINIIENNILTKEIDLNKSYETMETIITIIDSDITEIIPKCLNLAYKNIKNYNKENDVDNILFDFMINEFEESITDLSEKTIKNNIDILIKIIKETGNAEIVSNENVDIIIKNVENIDIDSQDNSLIYYGASLKL